MKHELVLLAGKVDWDWIDREIAPRYRDEGRPGIETRFVIGLLIRRNGRFRGEAAEDAGGREHTAEATLGPTPCWTT